MKLSCLQENLSRGLGIVGRAVASRTTLPITQNVLITANSGGSDQHGLKLSATNLEIAISVWIGAQVEEEGTLTIPARLVNDFVNSLPAERVDIEAPEEKGRAKVLQIKCARVQTRINGTEADEFPPIPSVQGGVSIKFDPQVLRSIIAQVALAAATEDSRPVLTGVKIEIEGDRFTLAAADGFRLAVRSGTLKQAIPDPVQFILPAKTLNEVSRLLSDTARGGDPVEMVMAPNKSQVLFRFGAGQGAGHGAGHGQIELVSQLIQGAFPNYKQLIPENKQTRATIGVADFLRSVKTASIFARDGSGLVRIHLLPGSPGVVRTVARAEELGETVSELDAHIEGPEAKIAFSSRYLQEVLQVVGTERVHLDVTTPSSPGVFRPAHEGANGSSADAYTHVVMPMFVQW